jgi:hypothetical protein
MNCNSDASAAVQHDASLLPENVSFRCGTFAVFMNFNQKFMAGNGELWRGESCFVGEVHFGFHFRTILLEFQFN